MEVTTSEQAELLNAALDALYYQDGIRKPLTSQRLKQVKAYKAKLNEANALMIDGILQRHEKHKRFLEAYEKGCSHPYLYILLGEGHAQYGEGSIDVSEQVLEYYRKAVDGMYVYHHSFSPFAIEHIGVLSKYHESHSALNTLIEPSLFLLALPQ